MVADPTPTEVGTIFARLKLQPEEFLADVDRVKAAVAELGRERPTVTVTADTGEALARLAEVQAAADEVNGSTVRGPGTSTPSAPSSGGSGGTARLTSAEAATRRLTAAQDALAAAESRVAAAKQRVTIADTAALAAAAAAEAEASRTRRNDEAVAAAQDKATIADARAEIALVALIETERKVEAAKRKVAEASLAAAAAQEAENAASGTASSGGKGGSGGVQQWQLIVGLVAALIPLVGPLGGYLVGVAGGFTMMGAAGVAAILGIRKEMAAGTALGQQYNAGLSVLGEGLDTIEHTGAAVTLRGFQAAVQAVQDAMPFLNQETGMFGSILGGTVGFAVQATVALLRALNPLLVDGAVAVEGFAHELVGFASSNGMTSFVSFAVQQLPVVGALLQHVLGTVGNLVAATAPLGQVLMVALNGVLSVLDFLTSLGPAFSPVVGGALALWGAFKLYGVVGPWLNKVEGAVMKLVTAMLPATAAAAEHAVAVEAETVALEEATVAEGEAAAGAVALGSAIDFAAGPIGWIVAGVSALVVGLGAAAAASSDATSATEDYTSAVQADNGVIGENVRQQAAANLQKAGGADVAKKLGLSLKDLTDASLGNAAANAKVKAAVKAADDANAKANETRRYGTVLTTAENAVNDKAITLVTTQAAAQKKAIKAYNDLQTALGGTTISTSAQLRAQQALAASYGLSLPTYLAAQAANKQVAAQAAAAAAQMLLEGDYAGLLKTKLDALNGKAISAAEAQGAWASALDAAKSGMNQQSASLNENTRAGQENRAQLAQMIDTGQTALEQYANTAKNQGAVVQRYKDMKKALIDQMVANGEDRKTVTELVNEWFKIPKHVSTKVDAPGASHALSLAQQIAAAIAGIHDKTVTLTVYQQGVVDSNISKGMQYGSRVDGGTIARHAVTGATAVNRYTGTVRGNGGSLADQAGLWALANGEEIISNKAGQADRNRPLLKAINAGAVFAPAGSVSAQAPQKERTQRVVHVGGVHLHSPVAKDPVQSAEDASQLIASYASFPGL